MDERQVARIFWPLQTSLAPPVHCLAGGSAADSEQHHLVSIESLNSGRIIHFFQLIVDRMEQFRNGGVVVAVLPLS